jgi:hypothetical protein
MESEKTTAEKEASVTKSNLIITHPFKFGGTLGAQALNFRASERRG